MTKVACLLMTPQAFGGAESALQYAAGGLRSLGIDVEVLAMSTKGGSDWSNQCAKFIDRPMNWRKDDLEAILAGYDGIVLSDTYFGDRRLAEVVTTGKIAPWTSARHWNSTAKTVYERHELAKASPSWSREYVSFWPSVEEAFPETPWQRGILPYLTQDRLHDLTPLSGRIIDFGYVGRTDPKKGVLTFVSALEGLVRLMVSEGTQRRVNACITGAPTEIPGGPHIFAVSQKLEEWGWSLERADGTMKSKWNATDPRTGSKIYHTGAYGPDDLPKIFGSIKCFLNTTSGKYAPQHLEYVTMEALDAGCLVIAPTDWPDYHYGDSRPIVSTVPEESYRIKKGNRTIYNDVRPEAPDTTYLPFARKLQGALTFFDSPDADVQAETRAEYNRQVLAWAHDPKRAAEAYLRALHLL